MPEMIVNTIVVGEEKKYLYPVGNGYCVTAPLDAQVSEGDRIQYDAFKDGQGYLVSNMDDLSGGYYTLKQAAALMQMHPSALQKYVTGRDGIPTEPKLDSEMGFDDHGRACRKIPIRTFEAWRNQYLAKKPFGARLHLERRIKTGE